MPFFIDQEAELIIDQEVGLECDESAVGFQGVYGSFSEKALDSFFINQPKKINYDRFEDVFKAIERDEIAYGVLPVENTSTGCVREVYDLLRRYGFYIVGEQCVKVEHHLMCCESGDMDSIRAVYSHPQAFMQSAAYLDQYQWKQMPFSNTAASAKYVRDSSRPDLAAIASEKAAELYGLKIIASHINFNSNNYTKFVIISKHLSTSKENDKISIVISTKHEAGMLYQVIGKIAEKKLNMLKIESRPNLEKSWEYYFYIDFEGNVAEDRVRTAIESIESKCVYFQLLGNYRSNT